MSALLSMKTVSGIGDLLRILSLSAAGNRIPVFSDHIIMLLSRNAGNRFFQNFFHFHFVFPDFPFYLIYEPEKSIDKEAKEKRKMRKVSPATVARRINALREELTDLERHEKETSSFTCTVGEDREKFRPSYDYEGTQRRYKEIPQEIRKLRHAMNVFNTSTMVPGFDMTVDQMLVYLPQLRELKKKLGEMKKAPISGRSCSSYGGVKEYTYSNYSVEKVAEDYKLISDEYAKAHTALDYLNATGEIEVDF